MPRKTAVKREREHAAEGTSATKQSHSTRPAYLADEDTHLERVYDGKPWTAELEARFFFAVEQFPPAGILAPLNLLNVHVMCNAEQRGTRLTADDIHKRAAMYWNATEDSDAVDPRDVAASAAEHSAQCFALPYELWEKKDAIYPPVPPSASPSLASRRRKGTASTSSSSS